MVATAQAVAGVEAVFVVELRVVAPPPNPPSALRVRRLTAALPLASLTAPPLPAQLLTLDATALRLEVVP